MWIYFAHIFGFTAGVNENDFQLTFPSKETKRSPPFPPNIMEITLVARKSMENFPCFSSLPVWEWYTPHTPGRRLENWQCCCSFCLCTFSDPAHRHCWAVIGCSAAAAGRCRNRFLAQHKDNHISSVHLLPHCVPSPTFSYGDLPRFIYSTLYFWGWEAIKTGGYIFIMGVLRPPIGCIFFCN